MLTALPASRLATPNPAGTGNIIKPACSGDRSRTFWKCWVITIRVPKKQDITTK
ncbi:Uncharacterised protein [Mycobacterium tuberculosis]|uniref:Uncharacterized protein n=1 Tax=Mycobacterium tuberculosis TaxID=1773 RepID=A0A916LFQ7_MYCTX|nr:Uncharacterised protein [Mycobacterium tuberculosis]CPA81896.1 Uncharacterised protein [Mycobacterium tuberculosis]